MVESYSKNANHNMRRPVVKEEIVDFMRTRQKQVMLKFIITMPKFVIFLLRVKLPCLLTLFQKVFMIA